MTLSEYTTRPETSSDGFGAFVAVAALDDLVVDTPVRVELDGRPPIMVVRTEDGVFAVDDTCSHQDTSLSAGWVEDCAVECPLHEACFDLRTGAAMGPPATQPIATHAVRVVDGLVSVWSGGADAASDAA
jgi:nitrite reductase/ring-hydroxylating ferredoxin subunit